MKRRLPSKFFKKIYRNPKHPRLKHQSQVSRKCLLPPKLRVNRRPRSTFLNNKRRGTLRPLSPHARERVASKCHAKRYKKLTPAFPNLVSITPREFLLSRF